VPSAFAVVLPASVTANIVLYRATDFAVTDPYDFAVLVKDVD
jgi:hypothetical protein